MPNRETTIALMAAQLLPQCLEEARQEENFLKAIARATNLYNHIKGNPDAQAPPAY